MNRSSGFTFIQVLVALVLIAVLAAIAYPSYIDAMRKGKRAEGRAALYDRLQQEELFYSRYNTYIRFSSTSADEEEKKFRWFSGGSPARSAYEIKADVCGEEPIRNCVMLTAEPGTANVDRKYRDPVCGRLTLSSTGERTPDDPGCWQ